MFRSEFSFTSPKKIKAKEMEVTFCEPILPPMWNHFVESENDTSAQSGATLLWSCKPLIKKPEVEAFLRLMDNAHQDISEFY